MERLNRFARALLAAFILSCLFMARPVLACEEAVAACGEESAGAFPLIENGQPVSVQWGEATPDPVIHAATNLIADLERVSGNAPGAVENTGRTILVGVLGDESPADRLAQRGLVDTAQIEGQWEGYVQAVVSEAGPQFDRALVILGADPRGAVYGIYDLSERMGVSPWYWWADVPVRQRDNLWITAGARADAPAVRYRGFFINDEDPAFGGWARERFGGVNAQVYEHVFELLLRLKGNYLWPAMWGKSLAEDDPASLALAAEMGIVLGTSHHEPLTRAHVEWERALEAGEASGEWNYATNPEGLQQFWREGMERFVASGADGVVTIGMRGDGDEAMSEDTAIPLLEQVVADQREIIAETTGRPPEETPQVWALYKEVQDYYDQGMQVPDDVILLFSDDNWGQIRRLPDLEAAPRAGGYGVYYHYDYVGGPRSYKWIDTIQQGKTWQQMNLAWERGARSLWVVNVGDIKPDEYQLDFFLDMAWDPVEMDVDALAEHSRQWAAQQFGEEHAEEIAAMLDEYARLASRRKPELYDIDFIDSPRGRALGDDWGTLTVRLSQLAQDGGLNETIAPAFFQLLAHRIMALSSHTDVYASVSAYRQIANRSSALAEGMAEMAELSFAASEGFARLYHEMLDGKWNHMMSQPHIGYTSWDDPDENIMPELVRLDGDETGPSELSLDPEKPRQIIPATKTSTRGTGAGLTYTDVPALGSLGSALTALPQGWPATTVEDGIFAEYAIDINPGVDIELEIALVPTLDTISDEGLRFGLQIDDGPVETVRFYLEPTNGQRDNPAQSAWNDAVIDNMVRITRDISGLDAGEHRVRLYRIDDNVVFDHIAWGSSAER